MKTKQIIYIGLTTVFVLWVNIRCSSEMNNDGTMEFVGNNVDKIVQDVKDLLDLLSELNTIYDDIEENRAEITEEAWEEIDTQVYDIFDTVSDQINELLENEVISQAEADGFIQDVEEARSNYGKGGSACEGQEGPCNEYLQDSRSDFDTVVRALEAKKEVVFLEEAERILNDPQAEQDFWSVLKMLKDLYAFFEQCDQENWASYNNQGIVPYCFWRDVVIIPGQLQVDVPFFSGMIDGVYQEAEGIVKIPELLYKMSEGIRQLAYAYSIGSIKCKQNKVNTTKARFDYLLEQLEVSGEKEELLNWIKEKNKIEVYLKDCEEVFELRREVADLYEMVNSWEELQQLYLQIKEMGTAYWQTLNEGDNLAHYESGKLFIFIASSLVPGVGQLSKAEKVKKVLQGLKSFTKTQWDELFYALNSTFKIGGKIAGITIKQVRRGTNGKIAIIGRKMNGHVITVADELISQGKTVEVFNKNYFSLNYKFNIDGQMKSWIDIENEFNALKELHGTIPNDVLQNSLMYKANQQWAQKLIDEGYEVIDIGYPAGETTDSVFYNMELNKIFQ